MLPRLTLALLGLCAAADGKLEIIGSGYGRTGTDSLKEALNTLGYKTYHMKELMHGGLRSDLDVWERAAKDGCDAHIKDIQALFDDNGWTAAVDWPASMCWEALTKVYPEVKVVHTERTSPEKWFESCSDSIMSTWQHFPMNVLVRVVPFLAKHAQMMDAIWSKMLAKPLTCLDPEFPAKYEQQFKWSYLANNFRVREYMNGIGGDRLLVQDHKEGWKYLCTFLNKPEPPTPFPRTNSKEEMNFSMRMLGAALIGGTVLVVGAAVWVVRRCCCAAKVSTVHHAGAESRAPAPEPALVAPTRAFVRRPV